MLTSMHGRNVRGSPHVRTGRHAGMFAGDLQQPRPAHARPLLAVTGPPSSSKSSLVNALASLAHPRKQYVAPVFAFASADASGSTPARRCTTRFAVYHGAAAFDILDTFAADDPWLARQLLPALMLGQLPLDLSMDRLQRQNFIEVLVQHLRQLDLQGANGATAPPRALLLALPIPVALRWMRHGAASGEAEAAAPTVARQLTWLAHSAGGLACRSAAAPGMIIVLTHKDAPEWASTTEADRRALLAFLADTCKVPTAHIVWANLAAEKDEIFERRLLPILRDLLVVERA